MVWSIWLCRNQNRFNNVKVPLHKAISFVSADTNLSSMLSKGHTSAVMEDFIILKAFFVQGHVRKAHSIKQKDWIPPLCNWFKCNTDGSTRGSTGHAASGGLFHGYRVSILGCFSSYIGISYALHAELIATMIIIELAFQKGWNKL